MVNTVKVEKPKISQKVTVNTVKGEKPKIMKSVNFIVEHDVSTHMLAVADMKVVDTNM